MLTRPIPLNPPPSLRSPIPRFFSVPGVYTDPVGANSALRKTPAISSTILQSRENTTTLNPASTIRDAPSSISPLFAILTKNTRGGGSPSNRNSPLFFLLLNCQLSTSFFSYSYALFCAAPNTIPNIFSILRTLSTKHRGWGTHQAQASSLFSTLQRSSSSLALFVTSLLHYLLSPCSFFGVTIPLRFQELP
jgi:hypothetical protein